MRRLTYALVLAALVLPAAAAAKTLDVEGPLTLKGQGQLRGELETANPARTRPVVLGGSAGVVRFVDLAGDLRVQCAGRSRAGKVYTCRLGVMRARLHGSHFRLALSARMYGMRLPEGVAGTLHGTFRILREDQPQRGEREQDRDRRPAPAKEGPPSDEEIDELIDAIAGGSG